MFAGLLPIILSILHLCDHCMIITVYENSRNWFLNQRQVHQHISVATQRSSVARKRWISRYKGRRLALYLYTRRTQQIGKQSITVLWKLYLPFTHLPAQSPPCMQNFQVAKGSRAAARAPPGPARWASAHARVVLPFPLPNCFNKIEIAQLKVGLTPLEVARWD